MLRIAPPAILLALTACHSTPPPKPATAPAEATLPPPKPDAPFVADPEPEPELGHGAGTGTGQGMARAHGIQLGTPTIVGSLDPALVRGVITRNRARLELCYTRQFETNPTLTGQLIAQFTIAPTGLVTSVTTTGLIPAVRTCVEGVIRALEFGKPTSPTQVSYPILFKSS